VGAVLARAGWGCAVMSDRMTAYQEFADVVAGVNDILNAMNVLNWDARTQMPSGGNESRGHQLATLSGLAQEQLVSDRLLRLLERAEREAFDLPEDSIERRSLQSVREASELFRRTPERLTRDLAQLRSEAQQRWAEARASSDFSIFAPALERMVVLQRELAEVIGYAEHPYDALVGLYEPGMTHSRLQTLFTELRAGILPLLERIQTAPAPRADFLHLDYPIELQRSFALEVAQAFGYDLARGRLDVSLHPFEISFTRHDVRITTRYRANFLPSCLFGVLHETGHALYEQGVAPELTRTALTSDLPGLYAVGGASFGAHESQSRLWENLIGRSLAFWALWYPRLQATFPDQLQDVDLETFHRAVNRVAPSPIRVEADEVTYNLHIMLRASLEAELIEGSLVVKDLPEAWNARMHQDLGLRPPDDARGVLQDIHWSSGYFGSFPTYTIGNVMASQFLQAAHAQIPGLENALGQGEYAPLLGWLTENIYRHGRRFTPSKLLEHTTGRGLDAKPYLEYLRKKFEGLYNLPAG
jgi:carboxypeptidase Taq